VILLFTVLLSIALALSVALAATMTALVIAPAYIFQFYKIVKIIFFWGCKSSDMERKKVKEIKA